MTAVAFTVAVLGFLLVAAAPYGLTFALSRASGLGHIPVAPGPPAGPMASAPAPRGRLPRRLARGLIEPPAFLPPLAVQCLKVALACGLAWWLGPFFHLSQPFNAVLAVIILMQGHAYGSLLNALQFLLGVGAGLALGIAANTLFGLSPLVVAGIMLVCLLLGGWLKVSGQGFNNQIAISALLVLASGSTNNVGRLWETVLGGVIGVAVAAMLWPPNPVARLRQDYRELRAMLGSDLLRSLELAGRSDSAEAAQANRRSVRRHSERADDSVAAIAPAEDALRWNPWHSGRMQDLGRLEDRLRLIAHLYRTARAVARQAAEADPSDPGHVGAWEEARPELLGA
ncbi:MAG: aromatic acid exporter family protein, partial [Candidatus Dormibacteraeota bacterium]|nr:aromatic acid exporter family protein [Candidatus Dormibacteraeota bacterium]